MILQAEVVGGIGGDVVSNVEAAYRRPASLAMQAVAADICTHIAGKLVAMYRKAIEVQDHRTQSEVVAHESEAAAQLMNLELFLPRPSFLHSNL